MSISRPIVAALVVLGAGLAAAGNVSAANCSNVKITLRNETSDEIRVTKFQYLDGVMWKTENMFGVDGHQDFEPNASGLSWTRDLGGVGGESTKFKATYKHRIGGTQYGTDKSVTVGPFTCVDNTTEKTLQLDK
jgi:hypothetical protein